MIHEKGVEALENVHKKIIDFNESLYDVHSYIRNQTFNHNKIDKLKIAEGLKSSQEKMDEFLHYLRSTSKFMPDSIAREMGLTSNRVQLLYDRFLILATDFNPNDELDHEQIGRLTADFDRRHKFLEPLNVYSILFAIVHEMALIAKFYETIYKSIAHAEDN